MTAPLIGIVVVNYNGGVLTLRCLERLHELTWPADRLRIVLVDNGSADGVVDETRRAWPDVLVEEVGRNVGFAAACNRAFELLREAPFVALLNNDAVPERDWLEPLVAAMADPAVGVATPKVLLSGTWQPIRIRSAAKQYGDDPRSLGVQVGGLRSDGRDVTHAALWASGAWGGEPGVGQMAPTIQWTDGDATVLVPTDAAGSELRLVLRCPGDTRSIELECGGEVTTVVATDTPGEVVLRPPAEPVRAINNVGTVTLDDGSVADRGYLEADRGQFDEPEDLEGWSGAAALLRGEFLRDVGDLDERFFLYYEDVDLSIRGRRRGWRYRYVPASVVHHDHSAAAGDVRALVRHLSARNRLVVLLKHAPPRVVARAIVELARDIRRTVDVDVVRARRAGRRPDWREAKALVRVGGGFARLAPHALASRMTELRSARR